MTRAIGRRVVQPKLPGLDPGRQQRAVPCGLEIEEAAALWQWCQMSMRRHPELQLLYAIPNGGLRAKKTAVDLQRTGVRAGVPDYCLPVARHGCHGLYLELKRVKDGKTSPAQEQWLRALTVEGYRAVVAEGWEDARGKIEAYLADRDVTDAIAEVEERVRSRGDG